MPTWSKIYIKMVQKLYEIGVLIGMSLVSYGAYLIYEPAFFIVAGIFIFIWCLVSGIGGKVNVSR